MSGKNPLDALEKAHEESYFHQQDQRLIEQMRQKMQRQQAAEEIKAETGLADDALVARLAELGIARETLPVLHLMPLLQIAWADGEIQGAEREMLLEAAAATGITDGPAREAFEGMLSQRPSAEMFGVALEFIRHMLDALPGDQGTAARENIEELAWRVADASGGVFGLWGRVEDEEKDALRNIAEKLTAGKPGATSKLLEKL